MCAGSFAGGMSRGSRFRWRSMPAVARFELFEVFVGQTIEPECPGLVAQLIGHRMLSSSSFPSGRSRWRRRGD
jgi:hypothetical protein